MQTICHTTEYKSIHPVFDELERFYSMTSTKAMQGIKSLIRQRYDWSFDYLHSLFEQMCGIDYPVEFVDHKYEPLTDLPDTNNIIIAFSGGKDSTAAILYYKSKGYNVYLYHALGINRSYPDEWKRAEAIAEYLDVPIHSEKILVDGKQEFPDHPMKNMIIANHALYWGITNGIGTKIAFGNYLDTELEVSSFYTSGNDSNDMWDAYLDIMERAIPNFQIYRELENATEALSLLASDKHLLELCQSCVGAQRFREWNKANNEKKYGIKLMPTRCGSCWKCAVEYIYMSDHDVLQYNKEYYRHCLDILKKNAKQEHGVIPQSLEDLWGGYFGYPIEESKYIGK